MLQTIDYLLHSITFENSTPLKITFKQKWQKSIILKIQKKKYFYDQINSFFEADLKKNNTNIMPVF